MSDPLVSVLVLAYNHGRFLPQALDSILAQEFDGRLEVLIGEDCSSDDTLSIARHYERTNPAVVRVITAPMNVGMHQNHRRLVDQSRGEFVAYCEGDDYWHSRRKLAVQLRAFRADERLVGVHTDFDHITFGGGRWRRLNDFARQMYPPMGSLTRYGDLLERNVIQTCTLMLRTEVAKAYVSSPFGMHPHCVVDLALCLFATHEGRGIAFLPASTATYRQVPGSATNSGDLAAIRRIRAQHDLIESAQLNLRPDPVRARHGHDLTDEALFHLAVRTGDRPLVLDVSERLRQSPRLRHRRLARIAHGLWKYPRMMPLIARIGRASGVRQMRRYS